MEGIVQSPLCLAKVSGVIYYRNRSPFAILTTLRQFEQYEDDPKCIEGIRQQLAIRMPKAAPRLEVSWLIV